MNRYLQYKHVELPWLSEIPAHWDIVRNKNVFSEIKDTVGEDSASHTLLSLTLKGIIPRDLESGKGKFPKDFDAYKIVKKGNMAFCLFDIDETPRTVGLSEYDGMLTGAYTILQVRNVNPRFSYYYYLALDNIKALRPLYSGLRKTINVGTFLGTKFPLPPRDEQDQIVRFLNWKVSGVNKLINIKRKEIERLEELKNNIVTKCVTKGLNNSVQLKYSGEEWIGNIPEHWTTVQIRRVFTVILGKMLATILSSDEDTYEEYVCAKDVHFNGVDLSALKKMWFSPIEKKQYKIKSGDLLIVEGGAGAGNAALVADLNDRIVYVQNSIHIVRSKSQQALNKYLCYWIGSLVKRGYMKYICSVATIPHYTKDKVLSTIMPLAPIEEQIKIVAFLDRKCQELDDIISFNNQQIRSLQEFKTRLISDTVTGKIDVRSIKIPEYEYVEEVDRALENAEGPENKPEEI